jgi:uncharacterized OB-fold protein
VHPFDCTIAAYATSERLLMSTEGPFSGREPPPLPVPNTISAPFWSGCDRSELLYQECLECWNVLFPPRRLCDRCGSRSLRWRQSRGRGTVYTWSVVWRPPTPAFLVPYVVAIIGLDEGVRILTNIIGTDKTTVRSGQRAVVEFHPVSGRNIPMFRLARTLDSTD